MNGNIDRADPPEHQQNNLPEGTKLLNGLRHCWRRNPKRNFLDVLRRKEVDKAAAAGASIEALLRENAALREENDTLKQALSFEERRWQWIKVASPCTTNNFWERTCTESPRWRWWTAWCPCCRRPLDISLFGYDEAVTSWPAEKSEAALDSRQNLEQEVTPAPTLWPAEESEACGATATASTSQPRYAYGATLWGSNPGFALGALVLGAALRRSGTKHDLVLMHTDDVPESARAMLSNVWKLKLVDLIKADNGLFSCPGTRFTHVFTKLHVLGLLEYEKVLLLDLDIAVLRCPDELFELNAPAAMHRIVAGAPHGARIDGRCFFAGEDLEPGSDVYEWGQGSGINAGVMLLQPDAKLHARVLKEVQMPFHPERIPGNGPEQDYLSRLYAPYWTNISVAYNYQLHRVFHALDAALYNGYAGEEYLPERLKLNLDELCLVHFSGEVKLWDYDPDCGETDGQFADRLLRDCASGYMQMWVDETGTPEQYASSYIRRDPDGTWIHPREDVDSATLADIIKRGKFLAQGAALKATEQWRKDCDEELPKLLTEHASSGQIRKSLSNPGWSKDAKFKYNEQVEIYWRGDWFPAWVSAAHENGTFSVTFEHAGFWGTGAQVWPTYLRHVDADPTAH